MNLGTKKCQNPPVEVWMVTGMYWKMSCCHVRFCFCSSDLTGAQDGSVRMFEWGHSQQIICFRSPGNSRVTRIRFNHQGNKVTNSHTPPALCTRIVNTLACWLPPYRCQAILSFATWLQSDVSLSHSETFSHFLCRSGTDHSGEVGFSTHCSSAQWFKHSELRHSPQANNFLRWCLSRSSAILPAWCSPERKIRFKRAKRNERI